MLGLGGLACLALSVGSQPPRLIWNATASVPVGLYLSTPTGHLKVGDLVVFAPSPPIAALLARRGWLPPGVPLVKPVAALPGQTVCRHGELIYVDDRLRARARSRDGQGRAMPGWSGCHRLRDGEIFVLAARRDSFDGRYLGVTPLDSVTARALPLLLKAEASS